MLAASMFPGALLDPNAPAWCLVVFFIAIRWASMGKVGGVALEDGTLFQ
jgi:hypothetical protein